MADPLRKTQPPLVDRILQCGKAAFDPSVAEEIRLVKQGEFTELLESTSTLALLPVLNLLVQPERVHSWLRTPIIAALARLPLRPRGVQHTIEFILSVHPTTANANSQPSGGRGAAISHEALNAVSRLLSSPPAGMAPSEWFQGIAPQLFALLDGEGEPEMDKAAAFVVGFGILGRRQYGAPGAPGWEAFVEPMFRSLDPSLVKTGSPRQLSHTKEADIINLRTDKILSSADEVARSLKRLSTLLSSHPNPALTKRLLRPILLPLWALTSWPTNNDNVKTRYCKPAKNLLKTLLQLSTSSKPSNGASQAASSSIFSDLLSNLLYNGNRSANAIYWRYVARSDGIESQQLSMNDTATIKLEDYRRIDGAVESFLNLLEDTPDIATEISTLFLGLFSKWISDRPKHSLSTIHIRESDEEGEDKIQIKLVEAKVMQRMMTEFPDKLVDNSSQVLEVCREVLFDFVNGDNLEDDNVALALSLLNIVFTAPNFRPALHTESTISDIETTLQQISKRTNLETSSTARNLVQLLRFRLMDASDMTEPASATDQHAEDRKTYRLAMSYITATDSPPPVRAQGLELISGLIRSNSPILDIPALVILFTSLLQDTEEYIYLRAVKSLIQLSKNHPRAVMKDLIDRYVDPNEEAELDQRLRIGEALLQVILSNPLAYTGDLASSISEGLLYTASRRGYRPKTEVSQEKKNKLKGKQDQEAEEAWDGPVPQLDEVLDIEMKEDEDLMAQIVGGWDNKRGMEDVRIRASALSILGSAIEANISGLSSSIVATAIDLSIHILTLEPEPEKGILRRSAILLIMSFVRALDMAREEGRKLGFGFVGKSLQDVLRILAYVEEVDGDGLVRQHAKDVIEGLKAWQMNELMPLHSGEEANEIRDLAGLAITPGRGETPEGRVRPRIEEIE